MSIAQHQPRNSTAHSGASAHGIYAHAEPNRRRGVNAPPAVKPKAPSTPAAVRSRDRIQTATQVVMLLAALVIVALGLAYLSGYARVTQEGYRRVHLLALVRQERELARQWSHQQAVLSAPEYIGHKARAQGMIRADDRQAVVIDRPGGPGDTGLMHGPM